MTAPARKRGPIERATRLELSRSSIKASDRGLAASALALAERADTLPPLHEALRCDSCDEVVDVPDELLRCSPGDLAIVLRELRMTMTRLTEGRTDGSPLARIAEELSRTEPGGPPLGHPER